MGAEEDEAEEDEAAAGARCVERASVECERVRVYLCVCRFVCVCVCVGLWRLPRPRGTTHTTYSLLLHVSLLRVVPDRVHHSPTARVDFGKNLDDLVQAVFCELL